MKRILYTLIALCTVGLLSCRKSSDNITIKQYDADQITQYIKNNGLTSMRPDDSPGGDTTGIYYQVITKGTGDAILPSTLVSYVYTAKTFDGKYSSTDTILNHINTYGGYITPNGLNLAINNIAKNYGAKIRVIIPSRLMYGINGTTLSAYNAAGTPVYSNIAGNQCFDYTINVINTHTTNTTVTPNVIVSKQADYDDQSILKYITANGLTGQYTQIQTGQYKGIWYRIIQAGATVASGTPIIDLNSTIGVQYTGTLFDGAVFDQGNTTDGTAAYISTVMDNIPAWQAVFPLVVNNVPVVTTGAKLSIITPSRFAYGQSANSQGAFPLPAFSCLRFEINLISVTN